MSENNAKPKVSKYTNLEPNVAAALSYLIAPLTGIAFFIMEKDDKFVRFHAFQSILFGIASFVIWSVFSSLFVILIGAFLLPLLSLAMFGLYLMLMWKAYNNEMYELPYLGKIAKDQTNK